MRKALRHEFVQYIPDALEEGVLYVSVAYATVVHRCCCGCGREVVTPLSPTDWRITFDGVSITLDPSIGNWSFPCKSHYWIEKNVVVPARKWTQKEISAGRKADARAKREYYDGESSEPDSGSSGRTTR